MACFWWVGSSFPRPNLLKLPWEGGGCYMLYFGPANIWSIAHSSKWGQNNTPGANSAQKNAAEGKREPVLSLCCNPNVNCDPVMLSKLVPWTCCLESESHTQLNAVSGLVFKGAWIGVLHNLVVPQSSLLGKTTVHSGIGQFLSS